MSLNIKRAETHRAAKRRARLTGESVTEAVDRAIQERLARVGAQTSENLAEWLRAIGRDCAKHLTEPYKSANPDDLLYDERGLPK